MKWTLFNFCLCICLMTIQPVSAQIGSGYIISGDIKGLDNRVQVILKSFNGRSNTSLVKSGRFSFKGKVETAGEPYTIIIAGKDSQLQLLLDNDSEMIVTGALTEWPKCLLKESNSKANGSFSDFKTQVQEPFGAAYQTYQQLMKSLTNKDSYSEWEMAIKKSNGIDSLKMILSREVYNTAKQTYIKGVFLFVGMNPDSYFTPELIRRWWPKTDIANAYDRLSERAKKSFYGKSLFEEVKKNN